jgi:phosphatidylinositol kinase/protein kinase (PI-3  family)
LDPRLEVDSFDVEHCKVLSSATVPLWLAWRNAETGACEQVIVKIGDDLRQDLLTLQMMKNFDCWWKEEAALDLKLKLYRCLPTGAFSGIIQVVADANTTSNINRERGGYRAVVNSSTLRQYLAEKNPDPLEYRRAIETFIYR